MDANERITLTIAYHSARVLLDSIAAHEVAAVEQEEFETLVCNLALDLAALTGRVEELAEQYPQFFCKSGSKTPV